MDEEYNRNTHLYRRACMSVDIYHLPRAHLTQSDCVFHNRVYSYHNSYTICRKQELLATGQTCISSPELMQFESYFDEI